MKKAISIILAILMIVATLPLAFAAETEIQPFVPVSVTVSASSSQMLKFVPEETVTYYVTSYAPDDIDPYVYIYGGEETCFFDDTDGYYNFREKYEFVEGNEYYIEVLVYSDEATFDFVLECVHSFVEDTCENCSYVCDHETEGKKLLTCDCGKENACKQIFLGDELNLVIEPDAPAVFFFVPEEDVTAVFYSDVYNEERLLDASASVYNAEGDEIAYNDDRFGSYDFVIFYTFEAGETYYLSVGSYYESLDIPLFFVEAQHTADDGEVHDVILVEKNDDAGCTEMIYTDGIYCDDCGMFIYGHEEDGYGFCRDYNEDEYCDFCGGYMGDEIEDDDEDITDDDDVTVEDDADVGITDVIDFTGLLRFTEIIRSLFKGIFSFLAAYLRFAFV